MDSILNVGMTSLYAKMAKFLFLDDLKLHENADVNRTKRSEMDNDFRTWCLLYFRCKEFKPSNGIEVFYGYLINDFVTYVSLVNCVVINGIRMHCFHICGLVLKLLEQLRGTYFDENLMILVTFRKFLLHDLENRDFVISPILFNFNFVQ